MMMIIILVVVVVVGSSSCQPRSCPLFLFLYQTTQISFFAKGESISVSYSSLSVNSANSSPLTPPLPSILSQTLDVITSAGGLLQLAGAKANTVLEDFETATESYAKKEVAETN